MGIGNWQSAFVVFDGPDGCGKTEIRKRIAQRLQQAGVPVTQCKDPGGTRVGDRIRSALLDYDLDEMDVHCETLLFMASRAQLLAEIVRPALEAGHVVLCDRFVSSTCAYQTAAGSDFEAIMKLAEFAVNSTWPDLTLILDVPVELGFERINKRYQSIGKTELTNPQSKSLKPKFDSMERRPLSFHERVRNNFLSLAEKYPRHIEIIDATESPEVVVKNVLATMEAQFG